MAGSGTLIGRPAAPSGRHPVGPSWQRLKAWFAQHLPVVIRSLRRGATAKKIRSVERALGRKLPEDLVESYRLHDGQEYPLFDAPGLVYGLPLLPLTNCLREWRHWKEAREGDEDGMRSLDAGCVSFPDGAVRQLYTHTAWVPVSEDCGGNNLGIDLDPGPKGTAGQVIVFGRDDDDNHCVLAASWGQFLTDLAEELEAGNYRIEQQEGAGSPTFDLAVPDVRHFHSAGKPWARAKMGLRRLPRRDAGVWRQCGWSRRRCVSFRRRYPGRGGGGP
jgi:cell wall assembly regulator SMI1